MPSYVDHLESQVEAQRHEIARLRRNEEAVNTILTRYAEHRLFIPIASVRAVIEPVTSAASLLSCTHPNCAEHGKSPCDGVGCDGREITSTLEPA